MPVYRSKARCTGIQPTLSLRSPRRMVTGDDMSQEKGARQHDQSVNAGHRGSRSSGRCRGRSVHTAGVRRGSLPRRGDVTESASVGTAVWALTALSQGSLGRFDGLLAASRTATVTDVRPPHAHTAELSDATVAIGSRQNAEKKGSRESGAIIPRA